MHRPKAWRTPLKHILFLSLDNSFKALTFPYDKDSFWQFDHAEKHGHSLDTTDHGLSFDQKNERQLSVKDSLKDSNKRSWLFNKIKASYRQEFHSSPRARSLDEWLTRGSFQSQNHQASKSCHVLVKSSLNSTQVHCTSDEWSRYELQTCGLSGKKEAT